MIKVKHFIREIYKLVVDLNHYLVHYRVAFDVYQVVNTNFIKAVFTHLSSDHLLVQNLKSKVIIRHVFEDVGIFVRTSIVLCCINR